MQKKQMIKELKEHLAARNELWKKAREGQMAALEAVCDKDAFIEGYISAMECNGSSGVDGTKSKVRYDKTDDGIILAFSWLGELHCVPQKQGIGECK